MQEAAEKINYKPDVSDGKKYKIDCSLCKRKTNHTVKKSFREAWSVGDGSISGINDFTIIQCDGCDTIHFCRVASNSEDVEPIFDDKGEPVGLEYPDTFSVYPLVSLKFESKLNYISIPKDVLGIYNETFTALESGLIRLSAAGIRSTLEQICISKGVPKSLKLDQKINRLFGQNTINEDMKNLLHNIRIFGNYSVHESENIEIEDLNTAWASLNSLVRYIYGTEDQKNYFLNKKA